MAAEAKALLDELMGRSRNLDPSQQPEDTKWSDEDVCKYFLCGFCPHELFTNTRADLGTCSKIHDDALRKSYQADPKFEKCGYEEDFLRFLNTMINDVEKRIKRGHQRLALNNQQAANGVSNGNEEKITMLTERINELVVQAEELGCEGKVEESQGVMKLVDQLKEERQCLEMQPANQDDGGPMMIKQMEVCEVCGAFLIVGDAPQRQDEHLMGKQHAGYAQVRNEIERRKQKVKDEVEAREANESKMRLEREGREKERQREREERRTKERDVDRRRDRGDRGGRDRDRSDRDRERGDRDRDRDKKRRSRSRSRDRGKDRRRSRSRERRRRRSSSRDRRSKRSRSRNRDRDRKRSSSRGKKSRRSSSRERRRDSRRSSGDRSSRSKARSGSKEKIQHDANNGESNKIFQTFGDGGNQLSQEETNNANPMEVEEGKYGMDGRGDKGESRELESGELTEKDEVESGQAYIQGDT